MLIDQQTLNEIFDTSTLQRGKRYFNEGRVIYLNASREGASIRRLEAEVEGSQRQIYQTIVAFDPRSPWALRSTCSCPVGMLCKHAVAVLLKANTQLEKDEAGDEAPASRRDEVELSSWLSALEDHVGATNPASNERLIYILHRRAHADSLTVTVEKVRVRKDGSLGKGSSTGAWIRADLETQRPKYVQAADVPVLIWLRAFPTSFRLSPQMEGVSGAHFLAAALETGRLFWGAERGRPLVAGGPLKTSPEWRQDPDGRWQLLLAELPDDVLITPTDPPYYIDTDAHKAGLLDVPVSGAMLQLLLDAPPLTSAAITRNLPALKPLLEQFSIELPADIKKPEVIESAPEPVLQFYALPGGERRRGLMAARLVFSYDGVLLMYTQPGRTVRAERPGPNNESESSTVFVERSLDLEQRYRARLENFIPLSRSEDAPALPEELLDDLTLPTHGHWLDFLTWTLPKLEAEGWQIEMDPSFEVPVVEATQWYGESRPADEEGWFDLELGIVENGQHIDLIPLLQRGLEYLRPALFTDSSGELDLPDHLWLHDDENLIRIPSDRVRPMLETLLELYRGKNADQPFRLPRIEAARLVGQSRADWRGGEQLRELGRKLTNFAGLEPVEAPPGLEADLRHYQQEGLNWLQFLRGAGLGGVLADDMGLGKTLQTLAHLWVEKQSNRLQQPALVVCPTSVIPNWEAEAARFTPGLAVVVLQGPARKKQFSSLGEADLVITGYPLIARDAEVHGSRCYSIVVFDEAQNLKNPRAAVSRAARAIRTDQKIALTGTPMENHLGELWSLFDLVLPGYLGNQEEFREFFRNPIEKDGNVERQQALSRRLRPFLLRRTKEQVTPELPDKTEMVKHIELTRGQRDLYETIRASMDKKIRDVMAQKGVARSQIEILEALLKLRQVCCHPALLKPGHGELSSAKLDYLLEMVTGLLEEDRKIIIFSQFTSMLSLIETALQQRGLAYAKLTGQTRDRAAPVRRFQDGEVPLFLVSLKAGGVGLNLVAADCVIHYDPWWNPAVERQATDRAWRIGQDKPVFVYRLICEGTVEERMQTLQQRKAKLADSVYGSKQAFSAALTAEDVRVLFHADPNAKLT